MDQVALTETLGTDDETLGDTTMNTTTTTLRITPRTNNSDNCLLCAKPVTHSQWFVHCVNGWLNEIVPAGVEWDEASDMGCWPVGPECIKKVPEEYRIDLLRREEPIDERNTEPKGDASSGAAGIGAHQSASSDAIVMARFLNDLDRRHAVSLPDEIAVAVRRMLAYETWCPSCRAGTCGAHVPK